MRAQDTDRRDDRPVLRLVLGGLSAVMPKLEHVGPPERHPLAPDVLDVLPDHLTNMSPTTAKLVQRLMDEVRELRQLVPEGGDDRADDAVTVTELRSMAGDLDELRSRVEDLLRRAGH